ncbi:hypothetical protein PWT90_02443 [Aphanocladium album]|nr:hypothetical protein PWT90_02443 [Aphanocladium album]
MKFQILTFAIAAVSPALGAAVQQHLQIPQPLDLSPLETNPLAKNPIVGGDNSLACVAEVTYADGNKEQLSDECRYVMNNHCYPSKLPFSLCIQTNDNMKDGYLDYADNHVDFHDDGCKTDSFAGPSGDGTFQDCEIPC